MIAVRPAFVVVTDDMFADPCPLFGIGGRRGAVGFDLCLIFDGDAEAEERFAPRFVECFHQFVGKGKVIGCGKGLVSRKIAENVRNIHIAESAVRSADVVQAYDRYVCLCQIVKKRKVQTDERGLPDAVHGFDLSRNV